MERAKVGRRALATADLARACTTTPQAMNGVLAILEREGLVTRRPHPTHGRIIAVDLTQEGRRRLDEATPAVRALEARIEEGLGPEGIADVKGWLVAAAGRLSGAPPPKRESPAGAGLAR